MKSGKIESLIKQICKLNEVKIDLEELNCDSNIPNAISRINKAIRAIKMSLTRDDYYVFDDGGTISCAYITKNHLNELLYNKAVYISESNYTEKFSIVIKEDDRVIINIDEKTEYVLEGNNAYEFIDLLETSYRLKK